MKWADKWLKIQKLLLFLTLFGCIATLFLYLFLYQSGFELAIIYTYFLLLSIFILQLFLIKTISRKTTVILIVLTLLLVRLPIVGLNVVYNVVATQGDQSYDTTALRYIVQTGHIQPNDITINFRNEPYSYYPAIHLLSSFLSLTTALPETVIIAIPPLLELFFFLVLAYLLAKKNIQLAGLFVIITITFGYGFFHAQFIRETFASILQAFLIFLILLSFLKNRSLNIRTVLITGVIILLCLSFSHFYLQFTLLALFLSTLIFMGPFSRKDLGGFFSPYNQKFLSNLNKKSIACMFIIGLLIFLAYDSLAAMNFIRLQGFPDLFTGIGQFLYNIFRAETASQLSTVGAQQLTFERYLIYLQQVSLIFFVIFLSTIFFLDKKVSRKVLLPMFLGVFAYFAFLSLRLAQGGVVNNLGLRASGLSLFFLSLYVIFLSNYVKNDTLKKLFYGTLILALISVFTFPALLTQAYKDHTLDYEVPAGVAKVITPYYPISAKPYVYVGKSYFMPDWFYAFDSYMDIPRHTISLENMTHASPNSIIYVDSLFFNEIRNASVILNNQRLVLLSDTVVSDYATSDT